MNNRSKFCKVVVVALATICATTIGLTGYICGAIMYCGEESRNQLRYYLLSDLRVYKHIQAGDLDFALAELGMRLAYQKEMLLGLEESSLNLSITHSKQFPLSNDVKRSVFDQIDKIYQSLPPEGTTSKITGQLVMPPPQRKEGETNGTSSWRDDWFSFEPN